MAGEIGMELTTEEQPEAQRQSPLKKFFSNPANIATALIFGASLAQPRDQSRDGLQTFMQRAAGAAAFRGALQGGMENKKLAREQTAFERAQAEKELGLREEQIGLQREGVGVQRQQLSQDQSQFESQMGFDREQQEARRQLELDLAKLRNATTEQDLIGIAMQSVPYLLETMQFDDALTPDQKMIIAQDKAMQGVIMFRDILRSGGQVVVGPDGKLYVDDGKGGRAFPVQTAAPGAGGPPATPTPEAPKALQLGPPAPGPFKPTLGQRIQESIQNINAAPVEVPAFEGKPAGVYGVAQQRFRQAFDSGGQFDRSDVKLLSRFGDAQLRTIGMTPEEIVKLRELAEQM